MPALETVTPRRRLPAALIQLAHRQSSEGSDTTPYRDEEADKPSHNVSPMTIGLVAGLLSLVMVLALAFMFREHIRRQRRRDAELLPSTVSAPTSSALPSMREKRRPKGETGGVSQSQPTVSSARSAKNGKHGRSKSTSSAAAAGGRSEPAVPSRSRSRPSPPVSPTTTTRDRRLPLSESLPIRPAGPLSAAAGDSSDDDDEEKCRSPSSRCPPPLPDLVPARSVSLSSSSTLSRSSSTTDGSPPTRSLSLSSPSSASIASTAQATRPAPGGRDEPAVVGGGRAYDQDCRRGSCGSSVGGAGSVVDK